jgi:hypothetical protein
LTLREELAFKKAQIKCNGTHINAISRRGYISECVVVDTTNPLALLFIWHYIYFSKEAL